MTKHEKAHITLRAAGVFLLLASGCSNNQPPASTPPEAATPAPASEPAASEAVSVEEGDLMDEHAESGVSENDVEAFARAYVAVATIERKYTDQLQAVQSPQEAEQIQEAAKNEMEDAIQNSGMTIDEFESLGQQAGRDEVLQIRIQEKIMEIEPPTGEVR